VELAGAMVDGGAARKVYQRLLIWTNELHH
jgi:hypothetical protein